MTADKSTGRILQALPWLWLAMSLAWAIVIIVTDQLAWPLALWIATTVAPLTYLRNSKSESNGPDTKGNQ